MSSNTEQRKNVLKFSYGGLLCYIFYKTGCSYSDILEKVTKRFNIPEDDLTFLQIANESGYIFEQQLFEYFILLFPSPEIVFYVRRHYRNSTSEGKEMRLQFSKNNSNKRQRDCDDDRHLYGTPIKRQNCFLGSLPGTEEPTSAKNARDLNKSASKRKVTKHQCLKSAKATSVPTRQRSIRV